MLLRTVSDASRQNRGMDRGWSEKRLSQRLDRAAIRTRTRGTEDLSSIENRKRIELWTADELWLLLSPKKSERRKQTFAFGYNHKCVTSRVEVYIENCAQPRHSQEQKNPLKLIAISRQVKQISAKHSDCKFWLFFFLQFVLFLCSRCFFWLFMFLFVFALSVRMPVCLCVCEKSANKCLCSWKTKRDLRQET